MWGRSRDWAQASLVHPCLTSIGLGPLTPKFNRATWPFLKIDMRHGAYRQEGNYRRHDICYFLKSTCGIGPFKNRHINNKTSDKGHGDFLNSTCNIGDTPSRAPGLVESVHGHHSTKLIGHLPLINHYESTFNIADTS